MAGPAAEEGGKIKGAAVGRRRRVRSVARTMVRAMMRSMGETSTASATSTKSRTATATTSSGPLRTSSALVLLGSNFLRVGDVQSFLRRAAFTAGSSVLSLVLLLALLIASARVRSVLAGIPRTPDEAIGLGRWRGTPRTAGMAVMRTGSANSRTSKRETGHERGKGSIGLVVNATAGSLVGVKLLDKVPEVHVVVWILVWTHDGCVYSVNCK
jgi:hypothetical protein